jgi:hypothetical protein
VAVTVTIDGVAYTIEKLPSGNIRVTHPSGQVNPMQGPGTDGVHSFEVHPCQSSWYARWNDHLPPAERGPAGPGRDGEKPWWSSKSWDRRKPER